MILKEYNLVCRNRKCDFVKKKSKDYGIELFCPVCSADLIWECPKCERPLQNPIRHYCSLCRAPLQIDIPEHQAADGESKE